jgi:hypothetical protein
MLEAPSLQKQIPQRRGRPRKNKEVGETQVPNKLRVRSKAEELLMRTIRLEPVEGESRGSGRRMRRTNAIATNVREKSWQLK